MGKLPSSGNACGVSRAEQTEQDRTWTVWQSVWEKKDNEMANRTEAASSFLLGSFLRGRDLGSDWDLNLNGLGQD